MGGRLRIGLSPVRRVARRSHGPGLFSYGRQPRCPRRRRHSHAVRRRALLRTRLPTGRFKRDVGVQAFALAVSAARLIAAHAHQKLAHDARARFRRRSEGPILQDQDGVAGLQRGVRRQVRRRGGGPCIADAGHAGVPHGSHARDPHGDRRRRRLSHALEIQLREFSRLCSPHGRMDGAGPVLSLASGRRGSRPLSSAGTRCAEAGRRIRPG